MIQDFRLAVRALLKSRGFTTAALLTLGLGIGANTVVFSVVNALLLRPLPLGTEPSRVVTLHSTHPSQHPQGWDDARLSYSDLEDVRRESTLLEDVGGYVGRSFTLSGDPSGGSNGEDAIRVEGGSVTPNLFRLLGVSPALGRNFLDSEGALPGFESVAILSYGLWRTRYGSDPSIIGKPVRFNDRELEVIGVMPPRFRFPERDDVWVPYDPGEGTERDDRALLAVGRLRAGASLEPARREVAAIAERLAARYPDSNRGWGIHVLPYRDLVVNEQSRLGAESLLGAVGLVLLIGCANLASLLLARGTERQKELSVRAALGAGRLALLRQLLAESLLLGLAGGILGTLLALWGLDAFVASFPEELPYWASFDIDLRVAAFIAGASLLASLLFGLAPALRTTRFDLVAALGSGRDPSSIRSHSRAQGLLVVGQIAASLALLVGAGLMFQSFVRLSTADAGFDDRPVLSFRVYLPGDVYDPLSTKVQFFREAIERIESLPGVQHAAATASIPTDDGGAPARIVQPEHPIVDGTELGVDVVGVTPGLFATLDVPLVDGRDFDAHDMEEGAPRVAIVNRHLAEKLWSRPSAEGREIGLVSGDAIEWIRVVGVAPDIQYEEFGEETAQSRLDVYLPYSAIGYRNMAFLVRAEAEADPASIAGSMRETMRRFAPAVPLFLLRTMAETRYFTTWEQRFITRTFVAFAVAAMLLACLGIYGLVAYRAARKTREIGIRIALGASRREVHGLFLGDGIALAAKGVGIGIVVSIGVGRVLEGMLYHVDAMSPGLYALSAAILAGAVLLATYLPARRAARIEPTEALRQG
jgi:putative ABC transport system permease protein